MFFTGSTSEQQIPFATSLNSQTSGAAPLNQVDFECNYYYTDRNRRKASFKKDIIGMSISACSRILFQVKAEGLRSILITQSKGPVIDKIELSSSVSAEARL